MEKEETDLKTSTAYWAGRMIGNDQAWEIAQEIVDEINEWKTVATNEILLAKSYQVNPSEKKGPENVSQDDEWPIINAERELQRRLKDRPSPEVPAVVGSSNFAGGWRACFCWFDEQMEERGYGNKWFKRIKLTKEREAK